MAKFLNRGYEGLGITANRPRRIYEGREFYDMFPQPTGTDPIVNTNAEVHDTLHFVAKVVKETLRDTKKVARALKKSNILTTSRAVFEFFYKHYQYKLDQPGVEQVRRPARAWRDRKTGIDCDCFATSVSSILTNLGIDHYLKIIGINGRDYFQHIYVVVPKYKDADISKRSNYWVIDPVLNSFDEEAPNITKTDYLKMEGIPLQYLNGVEDAGAAGLGREFDTLETSLNGVNDMEGLGWAKFRGAMHAHVRNTRRKIETNPSSVEAVYNPAELGRIYRQLDEAFSKDDATLMGELERIAANEHTALNARFAHAANAIHVHDDHLYGAAFGDVDDNMINTVSGLGKKGASKSKTAAANKKHKSGPATKIKNAAKKAKAITKAAGKKAGAGTKKALKKIGKAVVKHNPVSIAARAGFLTAMRTNFSMLAEKAYWGYQTKQYATSKGINPEYYDKCVELLAKIKKTFVGTLKGDESALKKAIVNGRAAKKIATQLKKRGMSGTGELMNIGVGGLGVVTEATVTASMAFLTPLVVLMNKLFKGKKSGLEASKKQGKKAKKNKNGSPVEDSVENENGTESQAASDDAAENMNETIDEANNPSNTINTEDGSVEAAAKANEEEPSAESSDENFNAATGGRKAAPGSMKATTEAGKSAPEGSTEESGKSGGSKAGLAIAALAILGVGAIAMSGKSKKQAVSGLGNFSAKRESKKLKKSLSKKKLKLPHGYQVEKREKIKAVNI